MLDRLSLDALKSAPRNLEARTRAWFADARTAPTRARSWAHLRREQGEVRIWQARVSTLEATSHLLERTTEVPVVARITGPAHATLRSRTEAIIAPSGDFTSLNAKEAIARIRDLSLVDALRAERWERANKARKTVLAALDRRLGDAVSQAA